MRRFKMALFSLGVGVLLLPTRALAWVINGEEQLFIPFWYDLSDAVCRYMISWCG